MKLIKGDVSEAITVLEQGNSLAPDNPVLMTALGRAYLQEGDLEKAVRVLERAVALDPDSGDFRYQLGRAYLKAGRRRDANVQMTRARSLSSSQTSRSCCSRRAKSFPQPARFNLFFFQCAEYNSVFIFTMTSLVIAVGSTRKPKLAAVHEALDQIARLFSANTAFEVLGIEVESGVPHTPCNRAKLMQGARQRAEALQSIARRRNESWNYFVGLEGGLDSIEEDGQRRVFLESWAYVSDGLRGHFGRSGALELPESLADEVLAQGTELSVAIDRFAQQTGIRDAQGAWGVLSANQITRQEAFRIAVIAAFAPFYNAELYNKEVSRQVGSGRLT